MSQIDLVKARAVQPLEGARLEMAFSDGRFGVADRSLAPLPPPQRRRLFARLRLLRRRRWPVAA